MAFDLHRHWFRALARWVPGMTKRAPYIPFYPSDWLSGTADLTPAEAGVYIQMLMLIYDTGGPIKADFARLSKRLNCPVSTLRGLVIGLCLSRKLTMAEGLISNERAEKELEARSEKSAKARNSVGARENKKQKSEGKNPVSSQSTECEGEAISAIDTTGVTHRTIIERSSNQNQNQIDDKEDKSSSSSGEDEDADFESWWGSYPKRQNRGEAEAAYRAALHRGATPEALAKALEVALSTDRRFAEPGGRFNPAPASWLADWSPKPEPPAASRGCVVAQAAWPVWIRVRRELGDCPETWLAAVDIDMDGLVFTPRGPVAAQRIRVDFGGAISRHGIRIAPVPALRVVAGQEAVA
ncbi:MAG: DUF1376 domain-containing protein [Bosea sp. (in: a-proteobacteria)]